MEDRNAFFETCSATFSNAGSQPVDCFFRVMVRNFMDCRTAFFECRSASFSNGNFFESRSANFVPKVHSLFECCFFGLQVRTQPFD